MDIDALLDACQEKLEYRFENPSLLRIALTHSSGADTPHLSNERMEFLGDSVLGYIICETVFIRYPDKLEGDLTKIKSAVVSRVTCQKVGKALCLDEFLILGRGLNKAYRLPSSILSNVVEAIIAAIYLDGGIDAAYRFIERNFNEELEKFGEDGDLENFKSVLQHLAQCKFGQTPTYQLLEISGPEHKKAFHVTVKIGSKKFQPAWGTTKKEAEQRAAENAIAIINDEPPPYMDAYE